MTAPGPDPDAVRALGVTENYAMDRLLFVDFSRPGAEESLVAEIRAIRLVEAIESGQNPVRTVLVGFPRRDRMP